MFRFEHAAYLIVVLHHYQSQSTLLEVQLGDLRPRTHTHTHTHLHTVHSLSERLMHVNVRVRESCLPEEETDLGGALKH